MSIEIVLAEIVSTISDKFGVINHIGLLFINIVLMEKKAYF